MKGKTLQDRNLAGILHDRKTVAAAALVIWPPHHYGDLVYKKSTVVAINTVFPQVVSSFE